MSIKKIRSLVALILSVFLLGPEWAISGLCFREDASHSACRIQTHATPGCMCRTEHGVCSLEHPCECCRHKHKHAAGHNGGEPQTFMCTQGCQQHHSSFSLPAAAETAILAEKTLAAYEIISTPLPCVSPRGLASISLPPPKKPPRSILV